jgi:murein DD-endopeptidase MepM/ murein hydrolase activator NlpD
MPTLIKPALGRVTQGFYDASAAEHLGRSTHYAIDIGWYDYVAKQRDQRVFAAATGVLRIQPVHEGYGVNAIIDHSATAGLGVGSSHLGWEPQTFYAHLSSVTAALNGTVVTQGQHFATMGSSGAYAKGQTHLHFGFKTRFQPTYAYTWLDPRLYFGGPAGGGVTPVEDESAPEREDDMPIYYRATSNSPVLTANWTSPEGVTFPAGYSRIWSGDARVQFGFTYSDLWASNGADVPRRLPKIEGDRLKALAAAGYIPPLTINDMTGTELEILVYAPRL